MVGLRVVCISGMVGFLADGCSVLGFGVFLSVWWLRVGFCFATLGLCFDGFAGWFRLCGLGRRCSVDLVVSYFSVWGISCFWALVFWLRLVV